MAFSRVYYAAAGTDYAVPFNYQSASEVIVEVGGVATVAFTWLNSSTIRLNVAATGVVFIYRNTGKTTNKTTYTDGNVDDAASRNLVDTQFLYGVQEAVDIASAAVGLRDDDGVNFTARGVKIRDLADPTLATDAANKEYADGVGATETAAREAAILAEQNARIAADATLQNEISALANPVAVTGQTQIVTAAGNVTIGNQTRYLLMEQTVPAAVSIALPTTVVAGYAVDVIDSNGVAGSHNFTVTCSSGTIRGNTIFTLAEDYAAFTFIYDGLNWSVK